MSDPEAPEIPESVVEDAIEDYATWLADGECFPLVEDLYETGSALNWLLGNSSNIPYQYSDKLVRLNRLLMCIEKDIDARVKKKLEILDDTE